MHILETNTPRFLVYTFLSIQSIIMSLPVTESTRTRHWLTDDIPPLPKAFWPSQLSGAAQSETLFPIPVDDTSLDSVFPLKTVVTTTSRALGHVSATTTRIEVDHLEIQDIDEDLFKPPEDYRKLN